jgi:hypothetical protein
MANAGGRKNSELGTHQHEMNSGEGNGKPLLNINSCVENPRLDLQESKQTQTTTTTMFLKNVPNIKIKILLY